MLASDVLLSLLLLMPGVILACHAGGWAARRVGQPAVIGEILVGILLGPSLLGWLAPDLQQLFLPPDVLPVAAALGHLALLVFVFLIGHDLDLPGLRTQRRVLVGVSFASLLLPLLLGAALASAMYPRFAPPGVHQLPFMLFVAVALSITAFPVLARLLAERDLQSTQLGSFALAVAATADAIAWCLLAAVVALATTGSPLVALAAIGLLAALTIALIQARPVLGKLLTRAGDRSDDLVLVLLCAGLWLTAYATDRIGVHPAIGAFLFGVLTQRDLAPVQRSAARMRAVFVPVLLPLYFLDTGLHTNFTGLSWGQWGWTAAVLAVAVTGKWAGTAGAALLGGYDGRQAAALGILMNCRGITELVVLGIGRQIGVITSDLFTILVLMAIVTTAATGPLLDRLTRSRSGVRTEPLIGDSALPAAQSRTSAIGAPHDRAWHSRPS